MMLLLVQDNNGKVWYWTPIKKDEPFFLVGDTNRYIITEQEHGVELSTKEMEAKFPPR